MEKSPFSAWQREHARVLQVHISLQACEEKVALLGGAQVRVSPAASTQPAGLGQAVLLGDPAAVGTSTFSREDPWATHSLRATLGTISRVSWAGCDICFWIQFQVRSDI